MQKIIQIEGMTCSKCSKRVEDSLNTINGVVDIPKKGFANISVGRTQGVKLGEMDCK